MNIKKRFLALLVLFLIMTFFVGFACAAPVITVETENPSYYMVKDVVFSGINTVSDTVYLYIKGSNVQRTYLTNVAVEPDGTWTKEIKFGGNYDAGTYIIYAAASAGPAPGYFFDPDSTIATTSLTLKQPFLTATTESSTVAKGVDIKVTGTAEAASELRYYVFGQNLYKTGSTYVEDDASYSIEIATDGFPSGQYFLVIQHPMYDEVFNIADVSGNGLIRSNESGAPTDSSHLVLDATTRQSANAAEALCQALDTQNIDDIYVKLTFIVLIPTLTMHSVSDVVKGQPLKVSGTTNLKAGTDVTVDVLSTAFTAVDKTTVGSASFITLTTKVVKGADGVNTWEVTFDTAGLNVDSYTIQAIMADLSTSTVIKVLEENPPVSSVDEIELQPGWNFISVPKMLNQTINTAGSLFGAVDTDNQNILGYNTQTKTWIPLRATDIIQPLNGYWIYAATGTTISLTYPSTPTFPSVKTLYLGWNAVGLSAGESTSAKTALAGTSWRTLIPWNLAGAKYDSAIVNGGSDANSPDRFMTLGNGYWLYADAQSTLVGLTA